MIVFYKEFKSKRFFLGGGRGRGRGDGGGWGYMDFIQTFWKLEA